MNDEKPKNIDENMFNSNQRVPGKTQVIAPIGNIHKENDVSQK